MASFTRGITFATNGTVTAENLHNLIDQTTPRAGIITDRSVLTTMSTGDRVLIADTDDATNAYFITTGSLVGQALSGATYDGASFTTGTVTNLTSSTATISTLAGNTTGGTFSGNIVATAGTVTTLTASTLTGALSGGTYSGNVIATAGTITTLNSTTGTITNLSTTLAGDFTISSGTGTLGTTGVTAGTYGTSTIVPTIAVDSKGRVTSVGTSAVSAGKVLQVVSKQITAPTSVSVVAAGTFYDIGSAPNDFQVSITPSSISSKILVSAVIATGLGAGGFFTYIRLVRDTTPIAIGDAGQPNQPRISGRIVYQGADTIDNIPIIWLDSPNTTSSVTYKIQATSTSNVVVVFNRPEYDTNVITEPRAPSSIVLTEVST